MIEKTGWSLEYISDGPNLQALKALSEAWHDQDLEAQGKKRRDIPSSIGESNSVDLPRNTWDGEREGTTKNAQIFNQMLLGTK